MKITRVEAIATANGASALRSSQSEAERLTFWAGRKAAFPAVGRISPEAERLLAVTRECLERAVRAARPGGRPRPCASPPRDLRRRWCRPGRTRGPRR